MPDSNPTPQINVSRIPGGSGIAGALFVVISMTIFLIGIPALRYFLLGAILVGAAAALIIRVIRRKTPAAPFTLFCSATDATERPTRHTAPRDDAGPMLQTVLPLA